MIYYLAVLETVLFWTGLVVFLWSLGRYVKRTGDIRSVVLFWQPTVAFDARELRINRVGLALMIIALLIRVGMFFLL